ncbi:hypothetical protein BSLG_004409 [Batrachochytrium salamandrivorans]|nr:hypothetical protein BSLG_004409 [Batrachochytrium salamandrivorans]
MAALRGSSLALVHCFQSNRGAIGTGASMHLIAQASLSSLAATRGCTSASIYPFPSSRFLTSFTMQPKTELHLSSWMQPHITKLATLRSHTVVINGVFLLWQNANFVASEHHDGSQLKWMRDHFSLTTNGIFVDGRIWTAITCGFSHITALHLGMNMFVLYSFIETTHDP